jgi:hypothetical protein
MKKKFTKRQIKEDKKRKRIARQIEEGTLPVLDRAELNLKDLKQFLKELKEMPTNKVGQEPWLQLHGAMELLLKECDTISTIPCDDIERQTTICVQTEPIIKEIVAEMHRISDEG